MRKGSVTLLIVTVGILFFALGGFRWVIYHSLFAGIGQLEDALKAAPQARAAGRELAILCQACAAHPEWFADEPPLSPAWTPPSILKLHPTWVDIKGDSASVEFGGGFHHFGYTLERDSSAHTAPGQTAWVLTFYSEDNGTRVVDRPTIAASDVLTEAQFVKRTLDELDRRIAAAHDTRVGGSDDAFATVQRCKFAIRHHEIERLKRDIRASAIRDAHDWRDVLLAYMIDRPTDSAGATSRLNQWARSFNDFSTWLLAAYAFDAGNDPVAAENAVKTACKFPADDPAWLSNNARYRGLAMCRRLYNAGRYATCVTLCDSLLKYSESQAYLGAEITTVRDACRNVQPLTAARLPEVDKGYLFDPFGGIDLTALQETAPSAPK
jgi:hypothetical protein